MMSSLLKCPVCGSAQTQSLYKLKGSDVVECRQCTLVFVPTVLPEVTSIYGQDYYSGPGDKGYTSYRSELVSHLITFTNYLKDAETLLGRIGRVLDIGCALGHFGEAARRRKWDVYVTDISDYAVEEARKKFGLNGFVTPVNKLPVKDQRFDLVTLYEVIEHMSDPAELLVQVQKTLNADGVMHLTTPNVSSLSARLMGKKWYHFKPSEHLLYFSPETLRLLLENCGFEVIKVKPVATVMKIHDILLRLERYWVWGARTASAIAKFLGLSNFRLKIYVGQMQAWAKPASRTQTVPIEQVKDILDIVCCPNCRSEIQLFEEIEAICTECEQSFEVVNGVINFSRYAKRSKQKIIGSS